MRHANTENSPTKQDFDRMLTERGKLEAAEAATFLHAYQIDKMIVSYAKRTVQTSNIIREEITPREIEIVTGLYQGSEESILELISTQKDHNKCVLIVGHNPIIYNIVLALSETNSPKYDSLIMTSMSTAQIVMIDFPSINSWKEIQRSKGNIIEIFVPSTLSPA